MDLISVVILVTISILVVFLVLTLTPIIRAQLKARNSGVSVNLKDAHALSGIPDLPQEFLNTAAELRKMDRDVYIGSLVDYHVAGGDLGNLKDGLEKIQASGKEVSFNTLLLLNLAKKDIDEALDKMDKVYKVLIKGFKEKDVEINYRCEFKINIQDAVWVNPNMEEIEENVKEKLTMAILSSEVSSDELPQFIKTHYLNRAFWRNQSNAIVLSQNISVAS